MFIPCRLAAVTLLIVVTLHDQVHAGAIIRGHKAQNHSRPYMALLRRELANGSTRFCGGILLNEDFVLTAAHCQAKSYEVFLGLQNRSEHKGVQQLSVAEEFPHEKYDNDTHVNDIMVLKLSSKAKLSEIVKPILLADKDQGALLPKSCSVAGWGRTEKDKSMSLYLMEARVELVKNEICTDQNVYCSSDAAGPAKGDSGGPLVCEDGRAYGVVSLSYKEDEDAPTLYMYTKVADNRAWLDEVLRNGTRLGWVQRQLNRNM